jgi:hypothetical protein
MYQGDAHSIALILYEDAETVAEYGFSDLSFKSGNNNNALINF